MATFTSETSSCLYALHILTGSWPSVCFPNKDAVEENDNDVRLILLELFISLIPKRRATISWDLVKHCKDLDNIGNHGWAKPFGNFLQKAIKALQKDTKNEEGSHRLWVDVVS